MNTMALSGAYIYCKHLHTYYIPIFNFTGELPVLSLLLIFQLGYLGVLKNNLAFTGFSSQ